MSFSFSEELVKHYHTELQSVLDRDGIEAFRIGGGETTATKQLSICFGGDTSARLQTFENQLHHVGLNIDLTQAKYEVPDIGTVHLANSLIGYMLADVIVLCFNDDNSIKRWLQDVEYAFLTLQKPVNKDKTLVISCKNLSLSMTLFNTYKRQILNLLSSLYQIGFVSIIKINFGRFGLSSNLISELLKEKGKNLSVGHGGMVLIPSGINRNLPDSELGSEIRIEKPFLMSQGQITQELYEQIIGENPSYIKGLYNPVDRVIWFDLLEFSNKLSGNEACYTDIVKGEYGSAKWREDCTGYRLPTDKEWEYAGRAFSDYKYSGSDYVEEVGLYYDRRKKTTQPVGQLKMNGFGLYDMSGNVWEWTWDEADWGAPDRIMRGGSWSDGDLRLCVGSRDFRRPIAQGGDYGGRLARSIR